MNCIEETSSPSICPFIARISASYSFQGDDDFKISPQHIFKPHVQLMLYGLSLIFRSNSSLSSASRFTLSISPLDVSNSEHDHCFDGMGLPPLPDTISTPRESLRALSRGNCLAEPRSSRQRCCWSTVSGQRGQIHTQKDRKLLQIHRKFNFGVQI